MRLLHILHRFVEAASGACRTHPREPRWPGEEADESDRLPGNLVLGGLVLALLVVGCASRPPAPTRAPSPPSAQVPVFAPIPRAPDGAGIFVEQARAMLGQPYRYGGSAPGGFDCSGLVQYAARSAGIVVPRTAEEQLRAGMPVARDALAGGDLVFLHLTHKELHVGIAIDSTRFIHAPSSGGRVRIDSLAAMPYAGGFFAARRIVPAPR